MFDSGFGGLTVARAVIDLLPGEDLVYIGDTGRYPYGPKPPDDIRRYAAELAWSLVKEHDVKALIVACNTAASSGLDDLRASLPVPVLDVVDPGASALVEATTSGRVGVIGTVGTIASGRLRPRRRGCRGGRRRRGQPDVGRLSRLRRVRRAWPHERRRGHRAGRAPARPRRRRRCRRPAVRLHPLPVPRPGHRRRHGSGRDAGRLGRRDGVRRPSHPRRARPAGRRRPRRCPPVPVERRHRDLPGPRRAAARPRAQPHGTMGAADPADP